MLPWMKQLSNTRAGLLVVLLFAFLPPAKAQTPSSAPPPKPSHTYRNPLLPEIEIADPDVIRVDSKYYLYPTSDARGYQVFVSDDLVHWELKGRAFEDPRRGDWAPDVFHNRRFDGRFYLYYTDNMAGAVPGEMKKQIGVAVA